MVTDFTSVFFIFASVFVMIYLLYLFKTSKRLNLFVEFLIFSVYAFVFLIFLFPGILRYFEIFFGIESPINFFIYLSIFVLFLICFYLYKEKEKQRIEITKLVREIALIKKK